MQSLSEKDYKLFQSLAGMTQEGLRKTMIKYLTDKYGSNKVIVDKDFVYAVGEIPIALVAHMDTVFKVQPTEIYYDTVKKVMWSPDGLGADDRAGVFCILKILQSGLRPSVIFTADEESGCLGATAMMEKVLKPLSELNYIIQLDRRGANDCVFYDCDNPDFVEYVESFGFAENFGSFSDISVICPMWDIAGVNLSVGYDNEHSYIETLNTTYMLQTISKVTQMLKEADIPAFDYIPRIRYSRKYGMYNYDFPGWDDVAWSSDYKCAKCGKTFSEYEVLPIISSKPPYDTVYYCGDCAGEGISWCNVCNDGYESDEPLTLTGECPKCKEKKSKARRL